MLGVIVTVQELQWLQQKKYEKLEYDIRTEMLASSAGIRSHYHNPLWRLRYLLGDPFKDRNLKYALPIAEKESYSYWKIYFPQNHSPIEIWDDFCST